MRFVINNGQTEQCKTVRSIKACAAMDIINKES